MKENTQRKTDKMLQDNCDHIAKDIDSLVDAGKWMEDALDIEWITFQDKKFKAARVLVAFGGPNIWVNTQTNTVEGYWWNDRANAYFKENKDLDSYLEEVYNSTK